MKIIFVAVLVLLGSAGRSFSQVPTNITTLVIVAEENVGTPQTLLPAATRMPYMSGLLSTSGTILTDYHTAQHPSIPGFNWILSGGNNGVTTNNCPYAGKNITNDNIFRHLIAAGLTFRFYIDGLTASGITAQDWLTCDAAAMATTMNWGWPPPFCDLWTPGTSGCDGIAGQSEAQQNVTYVDFSQFATDVTNGTLPNFAVVVPNLLHNFADTYPAAITTADTWLSNNISNYVNSPYMSPGGHGALIVFSEEGCSDDCNVFLGFTDSSCTGPQSAVGTCGGNGLLMFFGPSVKTNNTDVTSYSGTSGAGVGSLLRTMMTMMGMNSFPQAAATNPTMSELFLVPTEIVGPGRMLLR